MEKIVHYKIWNEIATLQRYFPQIITAPQLCIWFCAGLVHFDLIWFDLIWLSQYSCEIKTLYPCRSTRVALSWVIGMLQGGLTQADVGNRFGVHRHIVRSLWKRYQDTVLAHDWSRSRWPRGTPQRHNMYTSVMHLCNRYPTAKATARTIPGEHHISGRTLRNRLPAHGFCPCKPCVWPLVLPNHRRTRLQWSQNQRWRHVQ